MLVSTVRNNDYRYIDLQVKKILSELNEEDELNCFHEELSDKGNANEKENLNNGLAFSEYCDLLLNRYKVSNQNVLSNHNFENVFNEYSDEDSLKNDEIKRQLGRLAADLELDSDEGNNSVKMDMINDKSLASNDESYPTKFGSQTRSNQASPVESTELDNSFVGIISTKINSDPDFTETSKTTSKMHISADEDTNFDIFDLMKCSDDEVTNCDKPFCEKDELTLNEDLVNKYENNLGLNIVRNKDICWAAGNFDSDVFPLKNDDASNENSLLSFARESLNGDSRESFSQEWSFNGSMDCVSQEHAPDHHVIVPKKTVDITKIKGWRKKQFTVEKCLANRNSILKKTISKSNEFKDASQRGWESGITDVDNVFGNDQNKDYAFVCDKLDDFLDQEAELKINYEIPHLYAEYGIKLTSEELVSRPKFNLSTIKNRLPVKGLNKFVPAEKTAIVPSVCSENVKIEEKPLEISPVLVRKQSPKMKCAFPDKSHKYFNLWKESNLSKGKPMSLLKKELSIKRENSTEVTPPCRRSGRISQAVLNKPTAPCQVNDAIDRSDGSPVGTVLKPPNPVTPKSSSMDKKIFDFGTDYKFQIRKFGMVLYPGPFAPLNPFVMYHLRKIRSYRTLIDKKWANFAVSAVVQKGETTNNRRMILPLTCCFKYKNESAGNQPEEVKVEADPVTENDSDSKNLTADVEINSDAERSKEGEGEKPENGSVCKDVISTEMEIGGERRVSARRRDSATRLALTKKINEGKIDLYEEEVNCEDDPKDEIDIINSNSICNRSDNQNYFSDDSTSDSDKCDIVFEKRKSKTSIRKCIKENLRNLPEVIDIEEEGTEINSTVGLSPDSSKTAFNMVIARWLNKKLKELKQTENITSSIDNLKTVKLNVLELIKLNFIKENYLSGYINLWYLKSPETGGSRIFLTFSMNPPVEGAINLKMMSRFTVINPPNIIQEIITKDKYFDSNDFAILFCDGNHWEIHGSVNFALKKSVRGRSESEKIQVFHLTKTVFQELKMLHGVKRKNDKNKVLKWWIMHMMQDYTEITVRCGNQVGRISRSIIIKTWKTKVPSFIEFKGLRNVRPIGVGVDPSLWPYFLIGPYHMDDNHNLTLKLNSKIIPFEYYLPLDRVKPAFLLKRFVSSVIMHSWRNCRQVVGMWLYDRIARKQGSFIQVNTRVKKSGKYEPTAEHDYSLNKSKVVPFESKMGRNRKVPDKNKSKTTQEVFLVSNVPNLGYIKGELHPDHSITIEHPLKPERKWNSHRIGDWLNRIMRKRIKFIPSDFYVKWKIVKNAEQIRNLEPLNRSSLGGTHILCKKGLFYLLSLTKEKIEKLGLNESVVMDAIMNNPIIQEVAEVKELGKILLEKETCDLPMADVLQMALMEIEKLENEEKNLKKWRLAVEKERELLCQKYLEALDNCEVDENFKKTINFYVSGILENCRNGEKKFATSKREKENCRRLETISKCLKNVRILTSREKSDNFDSRLQNMKKGENPEEKISIKNSSNGMNNSGDEERSQSDNEKVRELETKIKSLHESLNKMNGGDMNLRELLTKRLNTMSQHLEKMKKSHNTNGKLSPVIGEIDSYTPGRSHCQGSSELNGPAEEGEHFQSDAFSEVEIRTRKMGIPSECVDTLRMKKDGSAGRITEKPIRRKTQIALSLLKKYVEEDQSTEGGDSHHKDEQSNDSSDENTIVEVVLGQPEGIRSRRKNSRGSESENVTATGSEDEEEEEMRDIVRFGELEFEEFSHGRKAILREDENHLNHSEGGNLQKQVKFKLIRPNSHGEWESRKKLRDRIDYVDMLPNGKPVLVNKKRKRGGGNDFLKKLRST